jgi:LTXXQ motif family protein
MAVARFDRRVAARPFARARFDRGPVQLFAVRSAWRRAAWPGPFFSSYATDDVFWPTPHDRAFWSYGGSEVLAGIFAPLSYERIAARSRRGARSERAWAREDLTGSGPCGDQSSRPANLATIDQEVRLTAEQRPVFDELQSAEARALDAMRPACPGDLPASPTGRLDAMARWTDALLEAVRIVRPPLERFYAALDDEQKARFTVGAAGGGVQAERQWFGSCDDPPAFRGLPTKQLARRLRLSEPQLAELEDFSAASRAAAKRIAESCPDDAPLTPTGRMVAIETRLTALRDALGMMRPPLESFYDALTDEQKARFERIGRSRRAG